MSDAPRPAAPRRLRAVRPEPPAELGDETTVLLRVPASRRGRRRRALRPRRRAAGRASRRSTARPTPTSGGARRFPVCEPATPYRWLLSGGDFGYAWLNALGRSAVRRPDADDFVATPEPGGARLAPRVRRLSGLPGSLRVVRARGRRRPSGRSRGTGTSSRPGAGRRRRSSGSAATSSASRQRLDHLASLGANVLYLTPVFPAGSTHRYDATDVRRRRPAARRRRRARFARHGRARARHPRRRRPDDEPRRAGHEWFVAALAGASPSAGSSSSTTRYEHGYACWTASRRCRSSTTGRRSFASACTRATDSVVRRWLRPPFARRLAHRRREHDRSSRGGRSSSRRWRAASARAATRDAAGRARRRRARARRARRPPRRRWHGTMNYAGFTRPVWAWLRGTTSRRGRRAAFFELPVGIPRFRASRSSDDARVPRRHSRGRRRSTRGRSSTATTRLAFRRSPARASASSSASGCR